MSRISIDADAHLVDEVMRRHGVSTPREAVDLALRRLVGDRFDSDEFLSLEGVGGEAGPSDDRSRDAGS